MPKDEIDRLLKSINTHDDWEVGRGDDLVYMRREGFDLVFYPEKDVLQVNGKEIIGKGVWKIKLAVLEAYREKEGITTRFEDVWIKRSVYK